MGRASVRVGISLSVFVEYLKKNSARSRNVSRSSPSVYRAATSKISLLRMS